MQQTILPDAQRLYEETSARVDKETTASTRIPGAGHPGGAGDAVVRRVREPLAGAPHSSPRQHRFRRGRDGRADHVDLGVHRAGHLDHRQPQREEHGRRVSQDRHHPGHHRAAGARRRDAVVDPARRRERPQAVLLPTHRHDAAAAVRIPRPRRCDRQGRPGRRRTVVAALACRRRPDQRLHRGRQLPGGDAGRAGPRRGRLDARVRPAGRGAGQGHRGEPRTAAQRHPQRPPGAVRRDRRRQRCCP